MEARTWSLDGHLAPVGAVPEVQRSGAESHHGRSHSYATCPACVAERADAAVEQYATAHGSAAQGLLAWLHGGRVGWLTGNPAVAPYWNYLQLDDQPESALLVALAYPLGIVQYRRLPGVRLYTPFGRITRQAQKLGAEEPLRTARRAANTLASYRVTSRGRRRRLIHKQARRAYLENGQRLVEAVLERPQYWHAVQRLAAALTSCDDLSGPVIDGLLADVPPRPTLLRVLS